MRALREELSSVEHPDYMGLGELDGEGNVNSTKMGDRCTGAGGFVDITQNAKCVVYLGTFTAKGARYSFEGNRLHILREGAVKKMVGHVAQVSFNGLRSRRSGQRVVIVTERAVFQLVPEGVRLIEIAPGIDLQTQVLDMGEASVRLRRRPLSCHLMVRRMK